MQHPGWFLSACLLACWYLRPGLAFGKGREGKGKGLLTKSREPGNQRIELSRFQRTIGVERSSSVSPLLTSCMVEPTKRVCPKPDTHSQGKSPVLRPTPRDAAPIGTHKRTQSMTIHPLSSPHHRYPLGPLGRPIPLLPASGPPGRP